MKEELVLLYDSAGNISGERFLREHVMPYLNLQYGKTQPEAIEKLAAQIQKK